MSKDYAQPDFYRFNEDSLKLVRHILNEVHEAKSILDLGAGCGVIGIELAQTLRPERLTLVETQNEFIPYIKHNLELFATKGEIFLGRFSDFKCADAYDLVVCNPPYYLPGKGMTSPDQRRKIAREFIIDGWEILIEKMQALGKRSFIVIKNDPEILKTVKACRAKMIFKNVDDLVIIEIKSDFE